MTVYYPQVCAVLQIIWEDFGSQDPSLQPAYTLKVLPKRMMAAINSYREADTFELEVDYKNFPFDPRLIRTCRVSLHAENMEKIAQGNEYVRIAPRDPSEGDTHNTVFLGFVDDVEIMMDGDQRSVRLKGRDYTSIYTDAPWAGDIVDTSRPIDVALRDVMSRLKATGDIILQDRTGLASLPLVKSFAADLGEYSSKRSSRRKESYWDVMTSLADQAGLILYMELDKLVLTIPRVLYSGTNSVGFIWGHNLSKLSMKRRVGRMKGFNVRVRSIIGKEVINVDIPLQARTLPNAGDNVFIPRLDAKGNPIRGEETVAPFATFSVSNVSNEAELITYGERIYEEMSRQQLEGEFTTYDMESFVMAPTKQKVDLTKLRNGAPITLLIDPQDMTAMSTLATEDEREQYLVKHNYDRQVAAVIAANFGRFNPVLYLREARMTFSQTDGWQLDVSWVNRIETSEANR